MDTDPNRLVVKTKVISLERGMLIQLLFRDGHMETLSLSDREAIMLGNAITKASEFNNPGN